ncbi:MAG: TonB-dependent receptor [Flavobacteriaceae bacterium]|nr:TonB-dependent receptor [Flavobacteriaceae bacterium]
MERRNKKTSIFFIFMLLVFCSSYAQNTNKQEALAHVINILEEQYHVQFNYAEDTIDGVFLQMPNKNLLFAEVLTFLESNTNLLFSKLSDGLILVKPKDDIMLCGYVKDKDNFQPLVSATIQTLKSSTTTDENGFFQIKIEDFAQPITIRFLGYKTVSKPYSEFLKSNCDDVFLVPNVQSLSEIVISNYITSGINKINNGSYEINFSDFDILPGLIDNDVLQSVQAFPGIMSLNETVSDINIRGGTHDQNLILWDGIKMYQSGHFFGLISMYNPQITHKVSILKNGSDVIYTDGVSGTINMQTERNINTEFKGNIGINLTDFNGFVDIPVGKKSSVQIAARKSISDFFKTPTYNEFFDRISQNTELENTTTITNTDKSFDFYDTSLRWLYKISEKDELRLNFIKVSNELIFNEKAIIDAVEKSRDSRLTQNSIAGALYYNRIWNNKLKTTFEAYETDYKLRAVNANIIDSQRFLQKNIVSESSIKLKADYKLNTRLAILGGYHFVETEVTNLDDVDVPLFRLLVSEVVRTHGVFSQVTYKSINNNTSINLGLRYNFIEKFSKSIYEPRLSFSQKFLENFTIDVLGEFKHQNTSQIINFQNDFLGIEKRRWQLSNNNDIPIIISKQISVGTSFSNNGWLVSIEAYYKNVEGITTQSQGFKNQYEFEKKSGSYQVTGLDLLLRKSIDRFNMWLSYSLMNNDYIFKDLEVNSFRSNFHISDAITIGTAYTDKNIKIAAGLNWHKGRPTTGPIKGDEIINNEVNFDATNSKSLEDYLRVDVSVLHDFKLGNKAKAKLGMSVWNVFNKKNELDNSYQTNNEVINETYQTSLGITPNAVFRLTF